MIQWSFFRYVNDYKSGVCVFGGSWIIILAETESRSVCA